MSQKGDTAGAVIGTIMAAGPAMVDKPFYESFAWLSAVAVLGIIVLSLSGLNLFLTVRKKLREDQDG